MYLNCVGFVGFSFVSNPVLNLLDSLDFNDDICFVTLHLLTLPSLELAIHPYTLNPRTFLHYGPV